MKPLLVLVALALLILAPLYCRTIWESRSNLLRARELRDSRATQDAIAVYRKAISFRSPFNNSAEAACQELFLLAISQSNPQVAIKALRELRSAIAGSRSFLDGFDSSSVYNRLLNSTDEKLSQLQGENGAAKFELINPAQVNFKYQFLVQLCFWGWVLSLIAMIWNGVSSEGVFKEKAFKLYLPVTVLFYICWLLSLSKA